MLSTDEEIKALETRIAVLKKQKIDTASKALMADLEKQDFIRLCRALPRTWFNPMIGNRPNSSVKYMADRCNIPLEGKRIDLYAVLDAYHGRILELQKVAEKFRNDDALEIKNRIQEEEFEKLKNQTQLTRIELQERINHLVPRELVRKKLQWLSIAFQALGKRLFKTKGGAEAQQALNEFLDNLATECDRGGNLNI